MYVLPVAAIIFIGAFLAGLFNPPFPEAKSANINPPGYTCCDSGDGEDCKPISSKTIRFSGKDYELLKSNSYPIARGHQYDHLEHTNTNIKGVGRVFLNIGNRPLDKTRSDSCKIEDKDKTDWIREI